MKTSIIIPTFNAIEYTKVCLYSLRLSTRAPYETIVVDNGSTDGTREFIKTQPDIKLIETKSNLGYSGACNLGIKASDSDYVVLSNNDVMFTPYWLTHLIHTLEKHPLFGLVGPVTNSAAGQHMQEYRTYKNYAECIFESQRIFNERSGLVLLVPTLMFFCTVIKRKTIYDIGYLDPDLGLGGCDDLDFCYRANMAGLDCVLDQAVFVHHFCSRSFFGNNLKYWALSKESIDLYNKKWLGISHIGTILKN